METESINKSGLTYQNKNRNTKEESTVKNKQFLEFSIVSLGKKIKKECGLILGTPLILISLLISPFLFIYDAFRWVDIKTRKITQPESAVINQIPTKNKTSTVSDQASTTSSKNNPVNDHSRELSGKTEHALKSRDDSDKGDKGNTAFTRQDITANAHHKPPLIEPEPQSADPSLGDDAACVTRVKDYFCPIDQINSIEAFERCFNPLIKIFKGSIDKFKPRDNTLVLCALCNNNDKRELFIDARQQVDNYLWENREEDHSTLDPEKVIPDSAKAIKTFMESIYNISNDAVAYISDIETKILKKQMKHSEPIEFLSTDDVSSILEKIVILQKRLKLNSSMEENKTVDCSGKTIGDNLIDEANIFIHELDKVFAQIFHKIKFFDTLSGDIILPGRIENNSLKERFAVYAEYQLYLIFKLEDLDSYEQSDKQNITWAAEILSAYSHFLISPFLLQKAIERERV